MLVGVALAYAGEAVLSLAIMLQMIVSLMPFRLICLLAARLLEPVML